MNRWDTPRDHIAERVGVSVNFCSDIELGKKGMSIETLTKFARALHISTDYLIYGKAETNDIRPIMAMLEHCDKDKIQYLEEIIKNFILATK